MAVTIKDVAHLAGVSTATVSLVLNGRSDARISEGTRVRVREAAAKLDFLPNIVAKSLISGKTQVLGLIVNDIQSHLMAQTIRGVERAAREQRHHVIVCEAACPAAEMDSVRWLRSRGVDALILASGIARTTDVADYLDRQGVPLVLINQEADETITSFLPDHRKVGEKAATLFLDAGYSSLVYIGPEGGRSSTERRAGFAAVTNGRRGLVKEILIPRSLRSRDLVRAAEHLVLEAVEAGCDAALCFNDFVALGCIQGLQRAGRNVPNDLALIGVDNLPLAEVTYPPIATFDLDMPEIGVQAAMAALDCGAPKGCIRHAPVFIARESGGRVLELAGIHADEPR